MPSRTAAADSRPARATARNTRTWSHSIADSSAIWRSCMHATQLAIHGIAMHFRNPHIERMPSHRIVAFVPVLAAASVHAEPRWSLTAEADPLAFAMSGYSIHVAARPPESHMRFGAAAFGSGNSKFPQFIDDVVFALNGSRDSNGGWHL